MYLARKFLQGFVKTGELTVIGLEGESRRYGVGEPEVAIHIHDASWPGRLARNPALAVGEGYMTGAFTLESGDLERLLELCLRNSRWGRDHWLSLAMSLVDRAAKRLYQYNPVSRSRQNVASHYELSAAFFDLFLDRQKQYSCGYFLSEDDDIDRAQEQKLAHIAAKLNLERGMTVLDIGCGWGGLAMYLARCCGVHVTGITLSNEQLQVAREQAYRADLGDRAEFLLCDYRHVRERYDRVVSVGMFEHVGRNHYRRFFRQLRACLKDDGIALVHSIGRADGPGATNAWTRKYIFPGGYSPALSEVVPVVERERLYMTDLEVLRLHYAETLRCWLQRFRDRREEARRMYNETFCRMWEFYLAASEASFRWGDLMVFQLQLARDINAVPLSRDYILAGERQLRARGEAPRAVPTLARVVPGEQGQKKAGPDRHRGQG